MKAAKAFRGLTCILSLLLAISIGLTSGMFSAEGHLSLIHISEPTRPY